MQTSGNELRSVSSAALDRLMPLHLVLTKDGTIASHGPTLIRLIDGPGVMGRNFFDTFEVRRPAGLATMSDLLAHTGEKLNVTLRGAQRTVPFRGLAVPIGDGAGLLVNLSFGIGVIDAVRQYKLTEGDFASTDLAVEMLYLVEANAAAMGALRGLARRLEDDKLMAEAQALTDTLTGLRNRRALTQTLEGLVHARVPLGLMHIDLDYFKTVNDTLGHAAGDHVLRVVAQILQRETRSEDTAARVGGDEFVLVYPGMTDPARLEAVARRIIEQLSQPIDFEGRACRISASVGIAMSSQYDQPDVARMHNDADEALYASKRDGRGRVRFHLPSDAERRLG